ncbi:hypothetical protein [Parasphingorhabdus sp.]|uniref:hypothetical protein n=1 Tax=Parasphingorhabdus sp. TaxID=2709688 RepID=UPI003A8E5B9D
MLIIGMFHITLDKENINRTISVYWKNKRDDHMLSIAISTFFALALFGAAMVIAMMFSQYRDRIVNVIQNGMEARQAEAIRQTTSYRRRTVKSSQPMTQNRAVKPAPLRVAA